MQGSVASQSGATPSQIPIEHEINLNLKQLTNTQLKLQLKAEEAIVDLAQSTQKILQSTDQLLVIASESGENAENDPTVHSRKVETIFKGIDKSSSTQSNVMSATQARDDLIELLHFDDKLMSCDQMSRDIERF